MRLLVCAAWVVFLADAAGVGRLTLDRFMDLLGFGAMPIVLLLSNLSKHLSLICT